MKVSLNIAQQLSNVDLKTLSIEDLVKLATERLGGVEGFDSLLNHYEGIVIAKVISCEKHPNADKLSLCKIDDGGKLQDVDRDDNGNVQVVCGAPNVREGLMIAWIPPGAVVPASYGEKELFVLEARDLRGQISNGMIASPRELGLNNDHEGILEVTEQVEPGTPFSSLYKLDDLIIDIENKMFTHRPDCFGQLGVARELAGIQGLKFVSPAWYRHPETLATGSSDFIKGIGVTIDVPELCPRYMAITFDSVKVEPSPIWLQSDLKRLGVRPVNNVVDITNYIMLTTAQPLHAFDFDKVAEDGRADIVVRKPKAGEKMTLLDGKEIEPHSEAILICNQDKPIALGGVMGGGNSEIDETTTRIVLECATFDMYSIRKTSMTHGLFTDAVTRFNKGQPAEQLSPVLYKTIEMIKEIVGAKPVGEVVDCYPSKCESKPVEVTVDFINSRLGSSFTVDEIEQSLVNVEFTVAKDGDNLVVTSPFWRTDIEIAEDIVEEVGRLYGFNNLPIELPSRSIKPVSADSRAQLKTHIRQTLARAGANEVLTHSFVHGNLLKKVGQKPEDSYALRNALSPDLQYYRQTLTPSLLDIVHANVKSGYDEFAIFEINKTHNKIHDQTNDGLPGQLNMISLVYTNNKGSDSAYYSARAYLDYLAKSLGFKLLYSPIEEDPGYPVTQPFDHKRSALVTVKEADVFLGIIGEYKQAVSGSLKLPNRTAGFEIGLDHILEAQKSGPKTQYKPISKYPSSEQDITLKVSAEVGFGQLESSLVDMLEATEYDFTLMPLSIFSKDDNSDKNISFRVTLTSHNHTLTTDEVSRVVDSLAINAEKELQAQRI
jgi:phenylalanyl-tRNA synthetase beta chain